MGLLILKWYSIVLMGVFILVQLGKMFYSDEGRVRLANFIAFIIQMPIIIYLIIK